MTERGLTVRNVEDGTDAYGQRISRSMVDQYRKDLSIPPLEKADVFAAFFKEDEARVQDLIKRSRAAAANATGPGPRIPLDQQIAAMTRELAELRATVESNVVPGRIAPSARSVDGLPVYAWGTCGDPAGDEPPEPADYVRPADEVGQLSRRAFGVRVRGDSMVGEDINDGDLVWVEPTDRYSPPCVVLARIEGMDGHDSGMVVKLYKRDRFLYSHGAEGEEIVACKTYQLMGLVVGIQPPARRVNWGR